MYRLDIRMNIMGEVMLLTQIHTLVMSILPTAHISVIPGACQ